MRFIPLALAGVLAATAVQALTPLHPFVTATCGPEFSALTITEPWEENSQTFANGAIRIFEIFIDPNVASGAALGVLHPVPNGDGGFNRACTAVHGSGDFRYFGQAHVAQATAVYDASVGLVISLPISFADGRETLTMRFAVNQATGIVSLQ